MSDSKRSINNAAVCLQIFLFSAALRTGKFASILLRCLYFFCCQTYEISLTFLDRNITKTISDNLSQFVWVKKIQPTKIKYQLYQDRTKALFGTAWIDLFQSSNSANVCWWIHLHDCCHCELWKMLQNVYLRPEKKKLRATNRARAINFNRRVLSPSKSSWHSVTGRLA